MQQGMMNAKARKTRKTNIIDIINKSIYCNQKQNNKKLCIVLFFIVLSSGDGK